MTNFTSIGSVATQVFQRIGSIPTDTSGAVVDLASGAVLMLGNLLNESIAVPLPANRQNILINLTCMYTLSRMMSAGVDFSYSLGEFSVNKGKGSDANASQLENFANQVNLEMKGIGRRVVWGKTYA